MAKRKMKNTESARTMRRSVAYSRLAAKADRAGEWRVAEKYRETASRLYDRAMRAKERGR